MRWMMVILVAATLAGCAMQSEPTDGLDAVGDDDGDGYPNAVEAYHGTDPLNATEYPDLWETVEVTGEFKGSIALGTDSFGVFPHCGQRDEEGFDRVTFEFDATPKGNFSDMRFRTMEVSLRIDDATNLDTDLHVYTEGGNEIGRSTAFNVLTGNTEMVSIEDGDVGVYLLRAYGCSGRGAFTIMAAANVDALPSMDQMLKDIS